MCSIYFLFHQGESFTLSVTSSCFIWFWRVLTWKICGVASNLLVEKAWLEVQYSLQLEAVDEFRRFWWEKREIARLFVIVSSGCILRHHFVFFYFFQNGKKLTKCLWNFIEPWIHWHIDQQHLQWKFKLKKFPPNLCYLKTLLKKRSKPNCSMAQALNLFVIYPG